MRQKGIVSANTNYLPTMSLWNAVVCGRDSDILSCGRDGGLDSNKPARDRGRTQEPSMLSSTPSRFRRPEGFPPSYFGNRLAGEDPVRQSRPPEPTADPGPVQEGGGGRAEGTRSHDPSPTSSTSTQTDTHAATPTRPRPHTMYGWCYTVCSPTGPAMWPLLRTTLAAGFPLISIQQPRSLLMMLGAPMLAASNSCHLTWLPPVPSYPFIYPAMLVVVAGFGRALPPRLTASSRC